MSNGGPGGGNQRGRGSGKRGKMQSGRGVGGGGRHGAGQVKAEFVNPYNFVRLGRPAEKQPPDSRRDLRGNTGRIRCTLKTVTPIFIPDPKRTQDPQGQGPKKMFFIREKGTKEGKPILPATSLKGMIRSVAEAASGSCLSQFDEGRLDYRVPRADLLAGIVTKLPDSSGLGEIRAMERAWIAKSEHQREVKTGKGVIHIAVVPEGAEDGSTVYVQTKECNNYKTSRGREVRMPFFVVTDICLEKKDGYEEGILRISGTSRKRERVFFGNLGTYRFTEEDKEDYDYILQGQIKRAADRGTKLYLQSEQLKEGNLVYFEKFEDDNGEWRARNISRVEVPRVRYRTGRGELLRRLGEGFLPCADVNELCPACRLFGTVVKNAGGEVTEPALAGKVAFDDAHLKEGQKPVFQRGLLKVLSTPKPTSCNFYLMDPKDPGKVRNYDGYSIDNKGRLNRDDVGHDVVIRGRKFYWHQKYDESLKKYFTTEQELNSLGMTTRLTGEAELLLPEATFEFTVEFTGLTDVELGLLLWSLELEEGMMHKLGMGKPIGLGSVKIETKLELMDAAKKYECYDAPPCRQVDKGVYIKAYKEWFLGLYKDEGVEKFDDIFPIADLITIMGYVPRSVSYPPPQGDPPRGFVWFGNHKGTPLMTTQEVKEGKTMS